MASLKEGKDMIITQHLSTNAVGLGMVFAMLSFMAGFFGYIIKSCLTILNKTTDVHSH
jgi:hypothetical protein